MTPADQTPDELRLKQLLNNKLASHELPPRGDGRTFAGSGSGSDCAMCGQKIDEDSLEYEVEWVQDGSIRIARLHRHCYDIWSPV